jgi:hypothetical protein
MVTEQKDERLSPNAISRCLPCIGDGIAGDANTGSTTVTESPQNQTQTLLENYSDHFPDSDTRLQGSGMQVWSAQVPYSGGFTVEDFLRWGEWITDWSPDNQNAPLR